MYFRSDNPVNDAIDFINSQDKVPHELPFKCSIYDCGELFDSGNGFQCVELHEDKICKTCFNGNHHLHWYQLQGLNDGDILELTFKKI